MTAPPVALTVAGSDSGGGAGLQADLHAFAALGVHGCTAVTALTAQSSTGVDAVHPVPPSFVVQQVRTVLADLPVAAVKTGMLGSAAVVEAVAGLAADGLLPGLVVDPVAVASSGARLLDAGAEQAYLDALLPHATVTTPNLAEAGVLLGAPVRTPEQQRQAARALGERTGTAVVVTGGHLDGDAVDVLWDGRALHELTGRRVATGSTHGTGCTFAAATAALLARGHELLPALRGAKEHVAALLVAGAGVRLGRGPGPVRAGSYGR